jgi:hypothetical protein
MPPVKAAGMMVNVLKLRQRARASVLVILACGLAGGCSQALSLIDARDAQTAARVKTALVNDPVVGVRPIEVAVADGIARLSGSVASDVERQRAEQIARAVDGVRDVRSALVVSTAAAGPSAAPEADAGAAGRSGAGELNEPEEATPGLLAVGVSLRHSRPADGDLEPALRLAPLFRLGSGRGLGVSLGFGWFGADVSAGSSTVGHVRIRPVMAGLAYTLGNDRVSASVSLVGGVAFNGLSQRQRSEGPIWALDVRNSLAWRPGASLWMELSRRTAVNVSIGYLVTRPRLGLLDNGVVRTRTLRGDTTMLNTGVVYKLF